MKLIIEIEKKNGEWFSRLLTPDRVELVSTDYLTKDMTLLQAKGFCETAVQFLEK